MGGVIEGWWVFFSFFLFFPCGSFSLLPFRMSLGGFSFSFNIFCLRPIKNKKKRNIQFKNLPHTQALQLGVDFLILIKDNTRTCFIFIYLFMYFLITVDV